MKTTAFTDIHLALDAKMAEYAGYNMPIHYGSLTEEHLAVRQELGMFDVSHMGEFIVRGADACAFLQVCSSNNVAKLTVGQVQYSCLLRPDGGIVDDMLVYNVQEDGYMLVVNAANVHKDWAYLNELREAEGFADAAIELIDISSKTALLAVQGPKAAEALQSLTDMDLAAMEYYSFEKGSFANMDKVLVSATGYTGAGGFEIYFDATVNDAHKMWHAITEAAEKAGVNLKPAGLGARDTLRLEMGYALYGNDINDNTTPIEANLGWITKLKKTPTCMCAPILQAQRTNGVDRKLVGLVLEGKGIARSGYEVLNEAGSSIGRLTSGGFSPCLEKSIALGYIDVDYCKVGTVVQVQIRKKTVDARIIKTPFLQDNVG